MSKLDLDTAAPVADFNPEDDAGRELESCVMGASFLLGNSVHNLQGEDLGVIKEIMLDTARGGIAYAVLSFGRWLGFGEKLFAVPWQAFSIDPEDHSLILDVAKAKFESSPGFSKHRWPDTVDPALGTALNGFYFSAPPSRRDG